MRESIGMGHILCVKVLPIFHELHEKSSCISKFRQIGAISVQKPSRDVPEPILGIHLDDTCSALQWFGTLWNP